MYSKNTKVLKMAQIAIFIAIIFLLAFVPYLGYINLGFMNATTIHIPVIIGAIVLGPKAGAILGGCFGLTSLIINSISPNATSFVFTPFYFVGEATAGNFLSLIICFVPRILIGVVAGYLFKGLTKSSKELSPVRQYTALTITGVIGSLTNTILVMSGIYFFFGERYAAAKQKSLSELFTIIMGIVSVNGVVEAIVAGILTAIIAKPLLKLARR